MSRIKEQVYLRHESGRLVINWETRAQLNANGSLDVSAPAAQEIVSITGYFKDTQIHLGLD